MTKIVKHVGVGVPIYRFTAGKITRQVIKFNNVMLHIWYVLGIDSRRVQKVILTDILSVLSVNLQDVLYSSDPLKYISPAYLIFFIPRRFV